MDNRRVSIGITLPYFLLKKIDDTRKDIPRSVFISKILEGYIK